MKLDPRQLEVLAAIVDTGGLTEAAHRLGKSQPSLSRSVSTLEQRLGAALFLSGKRPLQPTELCLRLAEEGRRILAANAAAADVVQGYRAGKSGAVRVGGTPIFMDGVISGMLASFQAANPEVRIDQTYGYAADLAERVLAGALDLAICPLRADALPAGLQFDRILRGHNVIACREGHPLLIGRGLTEASLKRYPWISPPEDSPLFQDMRQMLKALGNAEFRVSFSGGGLSAVLSVLMGSDALTILPYSVLFMLRRRYQLGTLSIKVEHPDRDVGLLYLPGASRTPASRRLRGFVAQQFETLAATIQHHEKQALWRG
jgi:DNA-binding transcriptional LysR family regulator